MALLRVSARSPRVLFEQPVEPENYTRFLNTQIQLIKSRVVIEPALRDQKVATLAVIKKQTDPAAWLEQVIRVTVVPETELMQVSVDVADRSEANVLIDAVVHSYLETVVESERENNIRRLEMLRRMWEHKQVELKSKRKSIRDLSDVTGSDDRPKLEIKRDLKIDDLRAAHVDLRKIRLDKVASETRLARKKGDKAATPLEIAAIEESVAILTAQEKYLTSVEKGLETLAKLNGTTMDLEAERDEIKLFQETATKIGREVELLEMEMDAPKRITLLSNAH